VSANIPLGPHERPFTIMGPSGALEAVVREVPGAKVCLVVCHPHPLHEGSMHNKVVTTTVRAGVMEGATSVRFNFRGVGRSEGGYANGIGEQDDLHAVIAWCKERYDCETLWLAGFSFGAYIAASVASSSGASACISIAPAVHHFDFTGIERGTFPWLVVQGEADEVVDPDLVYQWAAGLEGRHELVRIPGTGHFFHGQLLELRQAIINFLASCV
jgi:uncharacterized protein